MAENIVMRLIIVLVPMILSLTIHEFAHAWSAYKLGDDTASLQGRMTLNPLAHIDPIGTLLIPIFSVLNGQFSLIGWAKPVPVSPLRFRRNITMRKGMIITALAGPASNLALAFIASGVLVFSDSLGLQNKAVLTVLTQVFYMNVGLAVFNMLPLPPLDGSRMLPVHLQDKLMRYQMVTFIGLILMINFAPAMLNVPVTLIADAMVDFFHLFV
jgi:Zn-dependent protease